MDKGKTRTSKVSHALQKKKIKVDLIISSHAVRAIETSKILADGLQYPIEKIKIESTLYHSTGDGLYNLFFDLPEKYSSLMIVGHNPALTDFVNIFLHEKIENLPTSGVVSIGFDTDKWEEIPISKRKVNFALFPKSLTKKDWLNVQIKLNLLKGKINLPDSSFFNIKMTNANEKERYIRQ